MVFFAEIRLLNPFFVFLGEVSFFGVFLSVVSLNEVADENVEGADEHESTDENTDESKDEYSDEYDYSAEHASQEYMEHDAEDVTDSYSVVSFSFSWPQ